MTRAVLIFALALVVPAAAAAAAAAGERNLLWRVVQTCVAAHRLVGASFPCLAVTNAAHPDDGYAVLRAPFESTHIVVTPTVRTIGVEAPRLRAPGAPNYFADAWMARHFVVDQLPRPPTTSDLALAVNSRPGRSQDQLHIHVDCVRQDVRRSIGAATGALHPGAWTRIAPLPRSPRYFATPLAEHDLAGTNVFQLVQSGLGIDPDAMDDVTIVMVGADLHGTPGFVVLARQRVPATRDEAHGEALMDHSCKAFR